MSESDKKFHNSAFMREALSEACKAEAQDEVPVGAVIVRGGEIIARAHNMRETDQIGTHHAEILAIEQACKAVGSWRLSECDIYVTLEPCPMCAGALINSRIRTIYYGASDPKAGCCGTLYDLTGDGKFNHKPKVIGGVLADECGKILTNYFKKKRKE